MRRLDRTDFDVIVLGSGLSGCIVASILGRHGHRVLIIDKGVHPRFTIGESTIPQTSQLIQLLSRKYDVPELAVLGLQSPEGVRREIGPTSGVKRIFGFVYHDLGREHAPEQAHQFGNVWRVENHLFRQDVDSWLLTVALKHGCHVLQGTAPASVDLSPECATVVTDKGDSYTARFVIDGSGHRSVLAKQLDLREKPCSLRTSSRSMFTHVVGVKDFEDVAESAMGHRYREGTLHHLFKRGWFWVIPFNNWEGASNPLVSVGLTLDDRTWPEDPELGPEEEFLKFLDLLPSIGRQFEDAQVVRPWIRSKRIQYASTRSSGQRFALLSHTACFVDPLFSRGLVCTVEGIDQICTALLPALADDDFTEERFGRIDAEEKRVLSFTDRVVHGAYVALEDFGLWNLWVRIWAIGAHIIESNLGSVYAMGKASKVQPVADPLVTEYEHPGYKQVFNDAYDVISLYDGGELTVEQAKERLRGLLQAYDFEIPLRDQSTGQEWAMRNPLVRDIYLGIPEQHARWAEGRVDDHLATPAPVA